MIFLFYGAKYGFLKELKAAVGRANSFHWSQTTHQSVTHVENLLSITKTLI